MTFPCRPTRLRRRARPSPLLALAALALLLTPSHNAYSQQPKPFDPLTPDERERAARIATGDERTRAMLSRGKQRLISVELADDKPDESLRTRREDPDRAAQTGRFAEVVYFRYETNDGVRVLVDLYGNRVNNVSQLDARGVPLAFEEIEEAAALALRDRSLRSLLGSSADRYRAVRSDADNPDDESALRVEGLRLLTSSPNDPCWQHRCISLLFRRGREYLTYTDVTVDLTKQTVRVERTGRR